MSTLCPLFPAALKTLEPADWRKPEVIEFVEALNAIAAVIAALEYGKPEDVQLHRPIEAQPYPARSIQC